MMTSERVLQRRCACGNNAAHGQCDECRKKKESVTLQRKAVAGHASEQAPPIVHEVLSSAGQPLDPQTRAFMEPRFGHDFSKVRIHTDARAAESADAVAAHAYTVGSDIAFASGRYAPQTSSGQSLLAHELTHTVQQNRASESGLNLEVGETKDPAESDADALADLVMQGPGTVALPRISSDSYTVRRQSAPPVKCPDPNPKDFCQPYASRMEARACRDLMLQFNNLQKDAFGAEVADLYRSYLSRKSGENLTPRKFSDPNSPLVRGFVISPQTNARQEELIKLVVAAISAKCAQIQPLDPGIARELPLSRFVSREELVFPINYSDPYSIPGHIAGGVGSSDAGPDLRQVSGSVLLWRTTDDSGRTTGINLSTDFKFFVKDAVDFCPGDKGSSEEQGITTVMSRLEATGLFLSDEAFAYDMPFEVSFSGMSTDKELDFSVVKACFPDAVRPSVPKQAPPPAKPTPAPKDRDSDR